MAGRNKRKIENFDPNKSDSDDSTYGATTSQLARGKQAKSHRSKHPRKRQRREYDEDDSDEINDDSDAGEASFEDEEVEEEAELNERTGRPKRKSAKNHRAYQEEDTDESDDEALVASKSSKSAEKPSLIITLHTPQLKQQSTRKRAASGVEQPGKKQRRSSRIAHDDSEPILALTDSGHHADVVRPGTKSPEPFIQRPRRGGKGLKTVPQSFDAAADEEPSNVVATTMHGEALENVDIVASNEDLGETDDGEDNRAAQQAGDFALGGDGAFTEDTVAIPESEHGVSEIEDDDEDDEDPIAKPIRRSTRHATEDVSPRRGTARGLKSRHSRSQRGSQRNIQQESSDFEPQADDGGEEDVSDTQPSLASPRKDSQGPDDENSPGLRATRRRKPASRSRQSAGSEDRGSEVAEELAEELQDLQSARPRRSRARAPIVFDDKPRRTRKPVDYRILRPDLAPPIDEDDDPAPTPSRNARGGAGGSWHRSLYSTYGPFGGGDGPRPLFGGPGGIGAAANADSDSSDDDGLMQPRPPALGLTTGMTPTTANPGFGLFPPAITHNTDPQQVVAGTPANLGKVKDKQSLADADPLGVDQNVNFDGVGGLQGHIDQLKEMVALPLLYPEVFQRFHVTPPRGVLFHGPPGTGKTLLARALASSVSSQGRKVTFYMRKGADALSKWVGEAERQLRLLFEEARKTQPSIIFFDEIDGLAPVRSSKQEQIHASIVSTLLALMDGMDGRGQVIVIGATNRPDSVDPALRRPGRFDREFYFPLPEVEARRAIIDIHTRGWEPPLPSHFKDDIATQTKGYGGADLRALCTEAALNAVQRRYPQIYTSNEKLIIHPETINVTPKDFMISIRKIVPSSERSASSGAAPLPVSIEPLLKQPLTSVKDLVSEILPQRKPKTALEEAQYEDVSSDKGMKTERMQQEFDRSRIFRPRLLVSGLPGMGQQYLAAALLNHLEGLHVQTFDLPTLLSDATRTPEAAIIQMFSEVKRHKPSIIYIPNVDIWYRTIGDPARATFNGLLRSLSSTDPVLVFGVAEVDDSTIDRDLVKNLFGFSRKNQYSVDRPNKEARTSFFNSLQAYLECSPTDFPEPKRRKLRKLEQLQVAPVELPVVQRPTKAELQAQKRRDRYNLNQLKILIQKTMDQIRRVYKKFRHGIIDESQFQYLLDEADPAMVTSDLPHEQQRLSQFRPYEKAKDEHGEDGILEVATQKFYYNLETVTIERRLANGYYIRPKDFTADIKKLYKDAKTLGDEDRKLKAKELLSNIEVDMDTIEMSEPTLVSQLNGLWEREHGRKKQPQDQPRAEEVEEEQLQLMPAATPPANHEPEREMSPNGPLLLDKPTSQQRYSHQTSPSDPSQLSSLTNGALSDLSNLATQRASNGTSVPSREADQQLSTSSDNAQTGSGDQHSSFGQSAQTRPQSQFTGPPVSLQARRYTGSLSQRQTLTPMAEGSNVQDYTNYASTTSSEKKNTGSSGPFTQNTNTQSSHGQAEGPDLSMIPEGAPSNSQLPDTQSKPSSTQDTSDPLMDLIVADSQASSKTSRPSSQNTPTLPGPHRPTDINSLLNDDGPSSQRQVGRLRVNVSGIEDFLHELAGSTSGCSVEQLEQIYSAIMDKIWDTRGEWDRNKVIEACRAVTGDCLDDMRECQTFLAGSMDSDHY